MDRDRINRWLTLGANFGVLFGLIMVAVQIKQNTEITTAQLANDYYLADMQLELAMMGDDPVKSWIKAVYAPEDLNETDAAIIDRYFNIGITQISRLRYMNEIGLADDALVQERMMYLRWHLGNDVGRRWWSEAKKTYPPDLVQDVDEILSGSSFETNRRIVDALINPDESDTN